jgi:hypothetical protein
VFHKGSLLDIHKTLSFPEGWKLQEAEAWGSGGVYWPDPYLVEALWVEKERKPTIGLDALGGEFPIALGLTVFVFTR